MLNTQKEHEAGQEDDSEDGLHGVDGVAGHKFEVGGAEERQSCVDVVEHFGGLSNTVEVFVGVVGDC